MKFNDTVTRAFILATGMMLSLSQQVATAADGVTHFKEVPPSFGPTITYSCNLASHSNICRQYAIPLNRHDQIAELSEACETIPEAKFRKAPCDTTHLAGRCVKIVRDHHNPDIVYDNYYYQSESSPWNASEVERVCTDLEGQTAI